MFALAAYLAFKYVRRKQFIKSLRVARIAPEELQSRIKMGEQITIIDLREEADFLAHPYMIPTALRFPPDELEERHEDLPRDQDVILYCT